MYAVIETGGKQYRVEVGTELEVELFDAGAGDAVTLDRVLLVADGDQASIGRPLVAGASVSAEVVRQDRGDKTISFKYRPKARRRVKKGHRQDYLLLRITDVVLNGKSAAAALAKAQADAKTERERLEEGARRQAAEDAALAAKLAARSAPKADAKADAKPDTRAKADTKAAPTADTKSTVTTGAKSTTKPQAKSTGTTAAKPAARTPAKPAAKPAPKKDK
ncbi:MAG TPA: 50S ribosomal protein L21 [Candidatus Limnocylindrales bacterium]|nr:50S ribosomal protein L21 [Candidatus Limnocylindrales bacterium]